MKKRKEQERQREQDFRPQVLTDLAIKAFAPPEVDGKRVEKSVRDRGTDALLYLRINKAGAKSFVFLYEQDGVTRKLTLPGRWLPPEERKAGNHLSLAKARVLAEEAKEKVEGGGDPASDKAETNRKHREAKANTLLAVAEEFFTDEANQFGMRIDAEGEVSFVPSGKRSGEDWWRTLNRSVFGFRKLGDMPITQIKRKTHLKPLFENIRKESGPAAAEKARAILRAVFNWQQEEDEDFTSPIVSTSRKTGKQSARERWLEDPDEIRDLMTALDSLRGVPACYAPFIRMLLLTGCRRTEVADMSSAEIKNEVERGLHWVIPASRYKTKRDHVVPLTEQMKALIDLDKPKGFKGDDAWYILTSTGGEKGFSGFSKAKAKLDAEIAKIRKSEGRPPMEPWRLHDLRRTVASWMDKIGVLSDHIEHVLGHARPGIKGTYQRYDKYDEKRLALAKWETKLKAILDPTSDNNVVPFLKVEEIA